MQTKCMKRLTKSLVYFHRIEEEMCIKLKSEQKFMLLNDSAVIS